MPWSPFFWVKLMIICSPSAGCRFRRKPITVKLSPGPAPLFVSRFSPNVSRTQAVNAPGPSVSVSVFADGLCVSSAATKPFCSLSRRTESRIRAAYWRNGISLPLRFTVEGAVTATSCTFCGVKNCISPCRPLSASSIASSTGALHSAAGFALTFIFSGSSPELLSMAPASTTRSPWPATVAIR